MNDNDIEHLLMNQYNLDVTTSGNSTKALSSSEANTAASKTTSQQVEIHLESNQNYHHYAELREQQLRARETGSKPMYLSNS